MQSHPVSTPLTLLLGAYLTLCAPAKPRHVVTGLLLAGLATRAAAAAGRLAPEPLTFATRVVSASAAAGDALLRFPQGCPSTFTSLCFLIRWLRAPHVSPKQRGKPHGTVAAASTAKQCSPRHDAIFTTPFFGSAVCLPFLHALQVESPLLLADADDAYGCLPPAADADSAGGDSLPDSLPPLRLTEVLGSPEQADIACGSAATRQAALLAAVRLIGRLAGLLHDVQAFPELFSPARTALEALGARPGVHRVRRSRAQRSACQAA